MGTRSRKFPLLSRRARVLCRQRWPFFTTARRAESGGRVRQLVVVRCGRLPQRPGHGAVDRLAIFVAVELVVSSTALMLGYRTRSVVVPAARPNDPMAPYRTRVMRRSRLFGGASRPQLMCCAVFVLRSSTRSRRCAASSTWRWWTAPSPNPCASVLCTRPTDPDAEPFTARPLTRSRDRRRGRPHRAGAGSPDLCVGGDVRGVHRFAGR